MGGLVGLAVLALWLNPAFGIALILPGLVPHFFTGGAAGVYGNATGGRRGAIFGAFANGLLITFLPAFLLQVLGAFGSENTTFGDADFGWFGILIGLGARAGGAVGLGLILLVGAVVFGLGLFVQKKYVDGVDPAAAGSGSAGAAGLAASAASADDAPVAAETRTYPKIAPPKGAPVPPPPLED